MMSLPNYLSHLDSFTVTTGTIAVVSAIFSFVLSIGDSGQNKRVLGIPVERLKRASTYITLVTAIFTLFFNQKHDYDTQKEKSDAKIKQDSIENARYIKTLQSVDKTLVGQDSTLGRQQVTLLKQDSTLKTTAHILEAQRGELAAQARILDAQKIAFDTTRDVLQKQLEIQQGLNNNLAIEMANQRAILNTERNQQAINYPMSNGLGITMTVRAYIKGLADFFQPATDGHPFSVATETVDQFLKEHGIHVTTALINYWHFFSFDDMGFVDHSVQMSYDSAHIKRAVVFEYVPGQVSAVSGFIRSPLRYDAASGFLEWEMVFTCGGVKDNPDSVRSMNAILNKSKVHILYKFPGEKKWRLPNRQNAQKDLEFDHFEIVKISEVAYGVGWTLKIENPVYNSFAPTQIPGSVKSFWNVDAAPSDVWRYGVAEVDVPATLSKSPH